MSAENAEQVLGAHLGLLLHLHVGESIVVDDDLDEIVRHVGKVALLGELGPQTGQSGHVGEIGGRRGKHVGDDGGREDALRALERTLAHAAVLADVGARLELRLKRVRAVDLLVAQTIVVR